MDEKPIDYNDLLQDFHKHRTSSMGYTKRRSFVLNSQEDLPKINISTFIDFLYILNNLWFKRP